MMPLSAGGSPWSGRDYIGTALRTEAKAPRVLLAKAPRPNCARHFRGGVGTQACAALPP